MYPISARFVGEYLCERVLKSLYIENLATTIDNCLEFSFKFCLFGIHAALSFEPFDVVYEAIGYDLTDNSSWYGENLYLVSLLHCTRFKALRLKGVDFEMPVDGYGASRSPLSDNTMRSQNIQLCKVTVPFATIVSSQKNIIMSCVDHTGSEGG